MIKIIKQYFYKLFIFKKNLFRLYSAKDYINSDIYLNLYELNHVL